MIHWNFHKNEMDRAKQELTTGVSNTDDEDEDNDGPEANYECQICDNEQYIDEITSHTQNWCNECEDVQQFRKN